METDIYKDEGGWRAFSYLYFIHYKAFKAYKHPDGAAIIELLRKLYFNRRGKFWATVYLIFIAHKQVVVNQNKSMASCPEPKDDWQVSMGCRETTSLLNTLLNCERFLLTNFVKKKRKVYSYSVGLVITNMFKLIWRENW